MVLSVVISTVLLLGLTLPSAQDVERPGLVFSDAPVSRRSILFGGDAVAHGWGVGPKHTNDDLFILR